MQKPAGVFKIFVQPTYFVYGCAIKREKESQGFFGFHNYLDCPNCKVEFRSYQLWGENGHLQGEVISQDRFELAGRLRILARRQWLQGHNKALMGYRFLSGPAIYFVGGPR